MTKLSEVYIQKSFWMLGKTLDNCLGCNYCRLAGQKEHVKYNILPTEINSAFSNVPIAVNLFHGDPTLQYLNTEFLLFKLSCAKHKGPVVIITKGQVDKLDLDLLSHCGLDLHIALSIVGVKGQIDHDRLRWANESAEKVLKAGLKCSVELRPIIYGLNDGIELNNVFALCNDLGLSIGYSGLQATPEQQAAWASSGIVYEPYPGTKFGYKKTLSVEIENRIRALSKLYKVPAYSKTACLISAVHDLGRDYNAHYYRPNEVGCNFCSYRETCHGNREVMLMDPDTSMIPYKHEIIDTTEHMCHHARLGICNSFTDDCFHISGKMIKTVEKLTSADIRITKWLTGMTVDCEFVESPHLSCFWKR